MGIRNSIPQGVAIGKGKGELCTAGPSTSPRVAAEPPDRSEWCLSDYSVTSVPQGGTVGY